MYLSEILDNKRQEVDAARRLRPIEPLIEQSRIAPATRPFLGRLRQASRPVGLIAEVKKASPSAGIIRADFDPVQIAVEYERGGADCISVLTDERYFQGHLSFLAEIKVAVALPLLRKDFIVDEYQVYEARAAGADAILLIVAALEKAQLTDLYQLAKEIGLDILVETHTEEEMTVAAALGADLIGINSRDLKSFVTDLAVIERVAASAPTRALLVGESGIKTKDDVARLNRCGINAILVGETLMRSDDIPRAISDLFS